MLRHDWICFFANSSLCTLLFHPPPFTSTLFVLPLFLARFIFLTSAIDTYHYRGKNSAQFNIFPYLDRVWVLFLPFSSLASVISFA
jgi:hypothetical protein